MSILLLRFPFVLVDVQLVRAEGDCAGVGLRADRQIQVECSRKGGHSIGELGPSKLMSNLTSR